MIDGCINLPIRDNLTRLANNKIARLPLLYAPIVCNGKISLWYGEVDGSNPSRSTRMIISAVEYFVDIEEVSGSTPLSSTKQADIAPMVEQRIENSCVAGSSPAVGTK